MREIAEFIEGDVARVLLCSMDHLKLRLSEPGRSRLCSTHSGRDSVSLIMSLTLALMGNRSYVLDGMVTDLRCCDKWQRFFMTTLWEGRALDTQGLAVDETYTPLRSLLLVRWIYVRRRIDNNWKCLCVEYVTDPVYATFSREPLKRRNIT